LEVLDFIFLKIAVSGLYSNALALKKVKTLGFYSKKTTSLKGKGGDEMKRLIFMGVFLLVGCASTGVVPIGNDEYMISKTDMGDVWHTGEKVLAKLYIEANAYCAEKNMSLERIAEESADGKVFVRNASATLRFRCIPSYR